MQSRLIRNFRLVPLAASLLLAGGLAGALSAAQRPAPRTPARAAQLSPARRAQVRQTLGKLPLSFQRNRGQVDPQVKFVSRGPGFDLFLTSTEAVMALRKSAAPSKPGKPAAPTVVRMKLAGSNPAAPLTGAHPLPGKSHYLRGDDPQQWVKDVSHYGRVRYEGVYPGIDAVYYGNQGQLEYDFVVAPGADPQQIRLAFEGPERLEVDRRGDLLLHTPQGPLRQHKPVIYQEVDGARRPVAGQYVLLPTAASGKPAAPQVGFQLAAYDATRPLIIDPVLEWATYVGGTLFDGGTSIALDSNKNVYVTGISVSADFPVTAGSAQPTMTRFSLDAFVLKLDPTGSSLVYSTYLGGSNSDFAESIDVDGNGQAYVAGRTESFDFPGLGEPSGPACQTTAEEIVLGYVVKLSSSGNAFLYSHIVFSGSATVAHSVDVDAVGNAYVAGESEPGLETTPGAFQTESRGGTDAFVRKLDPSGALLYSTYLGGFAYESGRGVVVDSSGFAHVVGTTNSPNFPTLNPLQPAPAGNLDLWVARLDQAGAG